MMLKKKVYLLFLFIVFGLGIHVMGQDPQPPGGGGSPTEEPPTGAVPVDGGLSLLLAAGIGYGARKVYRLRTNNRK